MNFDFHAPSFGDEDFDLDDAQTSTPTCSFKTVNPIYKNSSHGYQQTPPSAKHMISVHNTSDEYHTANEDSFQVKANNTMNNSVIQQNNNTSNNMPPVGGAGIASATGVTTMAARKQMIPMEQSEPAKPLSAYALFFRDTVSAIKQQNPTCSFQELSKIVASMWDALDPIHKGVYNKKNELARTEYLKQMRIYQQCQQQKQEQLNASANEDLQTDINVTQQSTPQQITQSAQNNVNVQRSAEQVNNNVATATSANPAATVALNSSGPSDDKISFFNEVGSAQKCTRENCNKRAIINPDWEDEYCSNECVIIHCRNIFNAWVQSNFKAKQQQMPSATQEPTLT